MKEVKMTAQYLSVIRSILLIFFVIFLNNIVKGQYNASAAANYANTWTCDISDTLCSSTMYNPAYNYYPGNDCANFVSQCLKAGGLNLSSGTNGTGSGVDAWGCMPFCDYLHTNLVTYQNVQYQRLTGSYPSWFVQGDPAMIGDVNDYWQHAIFASTPSVPPLMNAHTNNRYQRPISFFYPGTTYTSCDFYHINSSSPPSNNSCTGAVSLTVNSACIYINGTTQGATSSGFSSCSGNMNDDDVFYSFNNGSSTSGNISVLGLDTFDAAFQVLTGPCGGSMFQISNGCVDATSTGLETFAFSGLNSNTTYYIRVGSHGNGAVSQGNFQICVYNSGAGLSYSENDSKITVFPNPAIDKINVELEIQDYYKQIIFTLYNYLGRKIFIEKVADVQPGKIAKSFNIKLINSGIYQLQIKPDDGPGIFKKVVIQKN